MQLIVVGRNNKNEKRGKTEFEKPQHRCRCCRRRRRRPASIALSFCPNVFGVT